MNPIMDRMEDRKKQIEEGFEFLQRHQAEIHEVDEGLLDLNQWFIKAEPDFSNKAIDLSFAGDKHVLDGIFGAFRKLGYNPSSRPGQKPQSYFSCFWTNPDKQIKYWMTFTSTQCTRIKVGTKMVEQDIFETVCQ